MDIEELLLNQPDASVGKNSSLPSSMRLAADDLNWVRQINHTVRTADTNKDGITSREELQQLVDSTGNPSTTRTHAVAALDNYGRLSSMAPESIKELAVDNVPVERFHDLVKEELIDDKSNGAGISSKDLTVAELVLDSKRSSDFRTKVVWIAGKQGDSMMKAGLATGIIGTGGFLLFNVATRGKYEAIGDAIHNIGLVGGVGLILTGTVMGLSSQEKAKELNEQFFKRKNFLSEIRKANP